MPLEASFAEVSKQVSKIHDIIISDMQYGSEKKNASKQEALSFSKHLTSTKYWFSRISSCNKKRYVLTLLGDIESAWALSLILKSIWSCRPKDAVLSVSQEDIWSRYDETPMDHNRTAVPVQMLVRVMKSDRAWFNTLGAESQAMVLLELLSVAGGPTMWAVLSRAQAIYKKYRDDQLLNIQECSVVQEPTPTKVETPLEQSKKEQHRRSSAPEYKDDVQKSRQRSSGKAREALERNLAQWNQIIQSMKNNLMLEEFEMVFNDGSKKNIWKVNRPQPGSIETVDFIQMLPSNIARRILSYLPRATLVQYAPVNKYWAYLVDEMKEEANQRIKLDLDIQKLENIMQCEDASSNATSQLEFDPVLPSSIGISTATSIRIHRRHSSLKPSEKSVAFSFRNLLIEKPAAVTRLPPIRNLADMSDRLNKRGAADENFRKWCQILLKQRKKKSCLPSIKPPLTRMQLAEEGVLKLTDRFPCPLLKESVNLPLFPPLVNDPSATSTVTKSKPALAHAMVPTTTKEAESKSKFSLWSRDFSSLYSAVKIASYQNLV